MIGAGNFLLNTEINDNFWSRTRETVRREGIPYQWKALNDMLPDTEPSYCIRNFRVAAGKETGGHGGRVFQDSDVAKWIEGAAYTLRWHPDDELEATIDGAIDDIVAAQLPDGYLNTYYTINGLDKRFTNLRDKHELYCAGHMLEAAVAYYQTTGKRKLLDAMSRYVDFIDSRLGPEEGKIHGYPGHPVLEMALMRLYDITHDPKHLRLAKYFIDERGQSPLFFREEGERYNNEYYWEDTYFQYQYYQAGMPVREQTEAQGHAVRAMYLYSGIADVARETGDEELAQVCRRLWNNTVNRRMYITGAIGSSEWGEAFTFDYDLPNDTIYGETCAAIGLVFFARRMLALEAESKYADVMERALYNGVISGMQLDGRSFFYVNPLEVLPEASLKDYAKRWVAVQRQKWFGCACCPPNLNRLIASLEDYIYSVNGKNLFVHLYAGGSVETEINKKTVRMDTQTDYPWDGKVIFTIHTAEDTDFALRLRIPGWCRRYSIRLNGEPADAPVTGGYAAIDRIWNDGDQVELVMEMEPLVVRANPHIYEDAGKAAVSRGPVIYCLEEADNFAGLHNIRLGDGVSGNFTAEWKPDKLGGIIELSSEGLRETDDGWGETAYSAVNPICSQPVRLTWIPYYCWANREPGEMRVWIRR